MRMRERGGGKVCEFSVCMKVMEKLVTCRFP